MTMSRLPIRRRPRPSEEGYMLVAVMFMLAILVFAMAVAAPRVKEDIQRDREIETMRRGKQYIRAIKLYYQKFHAYPPNVDALVKTNEIRFLRKKYIDPTTGKDEWKPVLFGQAKAPTAMGFFGQPIGGTSIAGIGPSGGNGLNGSNGLNGASGIGGINPAGGTSLFGTNGTSAFGTNGLGTNPGTAAGTTGNPGDFSSSTDPSASAAGGPGNGLGGPGNGSSGQTFGGAGIIGFSPGSPKQSILIYKKKNHYNEWEFVYDPLAETMMGGGNTGMIGQPASSTSTPIGTPQGGAGTGLTPTPAPAPAPQPAPQQ